MVYPGYQESNLNSLTVSKLIPAFERNLRNVFCAWLRNDVSSTPRSISLFTVSYIYMLGEVRIFRESLNPDLDPISLYSEDSHIERHLLRQLARDQRMMNEVDWSLIMQLVGFYKLEGEKTRLKCHPSEENQDVPMARILEKRLKGKILSLLDCSKQQMSEP